MQNPEYNGKLQEGAEKEIIPETPEEWDSLANRFEKIIKNWEKTQLSISPEFFLQAYLGAYYNISIYRQHKYFNTRGLAKQITPYLNHVSLTRTQQLFTLCRELQGKVFEKTRKTQEYPIIPSKLANPIEKILEQADDFVWSTSQDDLRCAFITGYNLITKIVFSIAKKKDESRKQDLGENQKKNKKTGPPEARIPRFLRISKYFLNLTGVDTIFNFDTNQTAFVGVLTGIYFFEIAWRQKKYLRTLGLHKGLPRILRRPKKADLNRFRAEIHGVCWKLAVDSLRRQRLAKKEKSGMLLPLRSIQLALFTANYGLPVNSDLFNSQGPLEPLNQMNADWFLTGLFVGYSLVMKISKMNQEKKSKSEKKDAGSNESQKTQKIYVPEKLYVEHLNELKDLNYVSVQEEVAFLYGVFTRRALNLEKTELKSERLKKQFTRFFPRLTETNTYVLCAQISYTILSLWAWEEIRKKSSFEGYFPELRWKLVKLLSKCPIDASAARVTLAFLQGYDAFDRLYQKIKTN